MFLYVFIAGSSPAKLALGYTVFCRNLVNINRKKCILNFARYEGTYSLNHFGYTLHIL